VQQPKHTKLQTNIDSLFLSFVVSFRGAGGDFYNIKREAKRDEKEKGAERKMIQ
jgi:hypothetical protein